MAKLDIAEKRLPQDGRIKIKMAGKDIDIRLSTVPVQNGERIVMRVLEKSSKVLQLEQLGYTGKVLEQLDELGRRKHGVLYVCGQQVQVRRLPYLQLLIELIHQTK